MASPRNDGSLVAAIKADTSGAIIAARQLADGIVRVGRTVQPTQDQLNALGKVYKDLGIKSEEWAKKQIDSVKSQITKLQELRRAGLVTANEYDRAIAAANRRLNGLAAGLGQDVRTNAQKAAEAMRALGVSTEASQAQAQQAIKDHIKELKRLKAAGEITAKDLKAAQDAANKALGVDTRTAVQKARDGLKELGVTSESVVKKQITGLKETIKQLEEWKRKGQISARDYAAGMETARKRIDDLNKSLGKDTRTASQRAADSMKELGVASERSVKKTIEALKEQEKALEKLRNSNKITASDFERSQKAIQQRIKQANESIGKDTKTTAEKASEAWKSFGLRRKAQIQEEIAQVKKQGEAALRAANLTAGERYRIEKALADRIKALNREAAQASANAFTQRMQAAAQGAGARLQSAGTKTSMYASAPAGAGLGFIVNEARQFEAGMNGVRAIIQDLSDEDFKKLEASARQYGATTIFTAGQVANAIQKLAQNGLSAEQILGGALGATVSSSAALNYDITATADLITDVMLQFKKGAGDLGDVADKLVGLRSSSKFSPEDLKFAFGMGGGVSGMSGMSMEDFMSGLALSSFAFSSGSDGGTSFKTYTGRLSSPDSLDARNEVGFSAYKVSPEVQAAQDAGSAALAAATQRLERAKQALEQYEGKDAAEKKSLRSRAEKAQDELDATIAENAANVAAARLLSNDTDGKLKTLAEQAEELRRVTKGMTDEQANATLGKIFGTDAIRTAMALREAGGVGVELMESRIAKGDAEAAAAIFMSGLNGEIAKMRSAISDLAIELGESGLLETVTKVVMKITEMVTAMGGWSDFSKEALVWGLAMTAVLGPILLTISSMLTIGTTLMTVFGTLGPLLARVFAPFVAFILGLPALPLTLFLAVATLIWTFRDEITAVFTAIFDWIGSKLSSFWNWITGAAEKPELQQAPDAAVPPPTAASAESMASKYQLDMATPDDRSVPKFAKGVVALRGPGTGTSDSIWAKLSRGESVIPDLSTRFWGSDFIRGIIDRDPTAVLKAVPVAAGGATSGLAAVHLHFGQSEHVLYGRPDVVRALTEDQNAKTMLRPTNPSRAFK